MRKQLTLLALSVSCSFATVQAQTYFYVENIWVSPAAPTDQDDISVDLNGNLSSTASSVVSATASVNGFTLTLEVVTQSGIGIPVLVPHTETVDVGQLPAGDYTIVITGSGTGDFAANPEHQFTVTGGTPSVCDSLIFADILWSPFDAGSITVHVFNPSTVIFDYPGFVLLDQNADTLAMETVDFFGIPPENWHILAVNDGATLPNGPFNGQLDLWTGFYSDLACSWDLPIDLCPPDSCTMIFPTVQDYGGGQVTGSFSYVVIDEDVPVASGNLYLQSGQLMDRDTICLPPGHFVMSLTADQLSGGGDPHFGVAAPGYAQAPFVQVVPEGTAAAPFDLFANCIGISTVVQEKPMGGLHHGLSDGALRVWRTDGAPLGRLQLCDAMGRLLSQVDAKTSEQRFPLADLAAGLYFLRALDTPNGAGTIRWVMP
jgi:hypothetical protein